MPMVLEEKFDNTIRFIEQIAKDVTVIIPHMGMLTGTKGNHLRIEYSTVTGEK